MSQPRALVRNAGDPQQVRRAKESQDQRRARELAELGELCTLPTFLDFVWRELTWCGPYKSVFDEHTGRMSHNAGKQDIGHQIIAEIAQADPSAYLRMQQRAAKINENIIEPAPRTEEPLEESREDTNNA